MFRTNLYQQRHHMIPLFWKRINMFYDDLDQLRCPMAPPLVEDAKYVLWLDSVFSKLAG